MAVGAAFGAAAGRNRRLPLLAVLAAGVISGLAGGMVRDFLLGLEAAAIQNWYYIPAVLAAALVGGFLAPRIVQGHLSYLMARGVAVGLLVTIGVQKGLEYRAPGDAAILLGVVTGTMGGATADVMAGERAAIFRQAYWGLAAVIASASIFWLVSTYVDFWVAIAAAVVMAASLDLLSWQLGWASPMSPATTTRATRPPRSAERSLQRGRRLASIWRVAERAVRPRFWRGQPGTGCGLHEPVLSNLSTLRRERGPRMPTDRSHAMDHLVVLMFENRSFDNLLGRLYEPGEVASFEGVAGKDLSNPIPAWAEHGSDRKAVSYGISADMNTPNPDPGEEYQHVNTQLFGIIDPESNRATSAENMAAPYNAPAPGQQPSMDGFVADYISAFTAEMGRQPTYDEYAQIMTGYTPEQMPVFSGLARGFATFDHWFCEVPSQTFTNRSFFHAATASGYVVNLSPPDSFPVHNTAETIFERLESKGLTWKVYCDPPAHVSFTALIHAARLKDRFATHFVTTDQFYEDAEKGDLPTYSFIEPNLIHGHNDMHPARERHPARLRS